MVTAKKITIHDVALAAGVSASTISLMLSGKGWISTTTGERINSIIEELGFMCNRQASALRDGQGGVTGLVVRNLSTSFYAELTAGLTGALEARGRVALLLHGGRDDEQLTQWLSSLLNQGVDGVITAETTGSSNGLWWITEEKAIPVISASRASYLDDAGTVCPDNMQAAQLLTKYLIRNGHRRIAWLGRQNSPLTRTEQAGDYCVILLEFGLSFRSDWVLEHASGQKQAAEAIMAFLRYNPTIGTVVCYNETIVMRAWFGLLGAGRQNGENGVDRYFKQRVSLAVSTDVTSTTPNDVPVTWTSTPARKLSITPVDRMMQKITHEEMHSSDLIIPVRLIAEK